MRSFLFLGQGWSWCCRRKAGRKNYGRGGWWPAHGWTRGNWGWFAAGKTPFGFGFRAAFGFRLLRTARLFLAFPRFGRGPLFKFAGLSLFADLGLDLGTLPIFHLAFTGIGKGARASFPFLFRQRT
jgi:hypothetical protein